MSDVALDTSAAIPLVLESHAEHGLVRRHLGSRRPRLTGQSLAETYSVLTRLPGDARLAPDDAVNLIERRFEPACVLDAHATRTVPTELAARGIAGGAVYDALVGLAAKSAGITLLTRDRRAVGTYRSLEIDIELITG